MNSSFAFRLASVVVSATCFAASASAVSIDLVSVGTYNVAPPLYNTIETVVFQKNSTPLPALANLNFTGNGVTFTMFGTYTSADLTTGFNFVGTIDGVATVGSTQSVHGTWTSTGVFGGLTGLFNGQGTWSAAYDAITGQSSYTNLVGEFDGAVPEPATMSILGLGFAGLIARRRKS